jgi:hypothetical protein
MPIAIDNNNENNKNNNVNSFAQSNNSSRNVRLTTLCSVTKEKLEDCRASARALAALLSSGIRSRQIMTREVAPRSSLHHISLRQGV